MKRSNQEVEQLVRDLQDRFVLSSNKVIGSYYMHSNWSDFINQHLEQINSVYFQKLHALAGKMYRVVASREPLNSEGYILESIYHFLKAKELEEAISGIQQVTPTLIANGLFHDVSEIFHQLQKLQHTQGHSLLLPPELLLAYADNLYTHDKERIAALEVLEPLTRSNKLGIKVQALRRKAWLLQEQEKSPHPDATKFAKEAYVLAQTNVKHERPNTATRISALKLEEDILFVLQHIAWFHCQYSDVQLYNSKRLVILKELSLIPMEERFARVGVAWVQLHEANIFREQGFYHQALPLYQEAYDIFDREDIPWRKGWAAYNLGEVYYALGDDAIWRNTKIETSPNEFNEAQNWFGTAMAIFKKMHAYSLITYNAHIESYQHYPTFTTSIRCLDNPLESFSLLSSNFSSERVVF